MRIVNRSFALACAVLAIVALACSPGAPLPPAATATPSVSGEIIVFAASSLTDAFGEIGQNFQAAYPGAWVTFNFASSSALRTQLEQGARADVFASANQQEMARARESNVTAGEEKIFARNRLVVIVPRTNPGGVARLRDLSKPGLKFVTAAPEVPVGVYTQDMLDRLSQDPAFGSDFKDRVNGNIVSRETNVRQVVAKINLGEADAAVVYATDVTPDLSDGIKAINIPDQYNTLAAYPIATAMPASNPRGADAFVSYVTGPAGQEVLKKWGFIPPD